MLYYKRYDSGRGRQRERWAGVVGVRRCARLAGGGLTRGPYQPRVKCNHRPCVYVLLNLALLPRPSFIASYSTHKASINSSTMHTSEYDYLFKLLLIGDSGVGKVRPISPP